MFLLLLSSFSKYLQTSFYLVVVKRSYNYDVNIEYLYPPLLIRHLTGSVLPTVAGPQVVNTTWINTDNKVVVLQLIAVLC